MIGSAIFKSDDTGSGGPVASRCSLDMDIMGSGSSIACEEVILEVAKCYHVWDLPGCGLVGRYVHHWRLQADL